MVMVEWDNQDICIKKQAELLGLNRSSLYYKPVGPSPEEIAIKNRIDEIYTQCPFFGSRRITAQLNREGLKVNRKTVQRYMREMAISGIWPGPNLSKRNQEHTVFPYLLGEVTVDHPNHVWGTDITYIRLTRGWMYLVAYLDWYSRYIVSWEMSLTLETAFVLEALSRGLERGKPEIVNSDQGSQYTSSQYIQMLQNAGIRISMDGRGRANDNIFTERLWRTIKYEEVYLNEYNTPKEARQGIAKYIDFYNNRRPHQSLNYRTPAEVYFGDRTGGGACLTGTYKTGITD